MFDSLRSRLLRDRPHRGDVRRLLGEPDPQFSSGDREWGYYLGWWSGLRIDPDSAQIMFDEQGRVDGVYRVQH